MSTKSVSVGVVTVTYNSAEVLQDFLTSVSQQANVESRLYVVDNASTDGTLQILESEDRIQHLEIIANKENLGVAVANNQGIVRALQDSCDFVLLLNNDTAFGPSTFVSLVDEADQNDLDLLSPLIEATEPLGSIWFGGGHFVARQGFRTFHENSGQPISQFPQHLKPTPYASTCALLVRPQVFVRIGLMDPVYFVYFDDVDFAVRAKAAGFTYWLSPAATILHKASSLTGGKSSPFTLKWYSRNWPLIALRHLSPFGAARALGFIQAWMFARLITRRDSFSTFRLRQASFVAGVKASRAPAPPRLRDSK